MKWLALDTSTPLLALGLYDGTKTIAELTLSSAQRHSQVLLQRVEELLRWAGWEKTDLEGLVVGLGPGGFTGLRVGVATAQGLAFALQKPMLGVSSLAALAHVTPSAPGLLVPCFDARKKEVYAGVFRRSHEDGSLEELHPHLLMTPTHLAEQLATHGETVTLVGSGATLYADVFQTVLGDRLVIPQTEALHEIRATGLAILAEAYLKTEGVPTRQPWEWSPVYIRPSEAEMNIGPPEGGPPLKDRLLPDGQLKPLEGQN